jgi:hypothetical protein
MVVRITVAEYFSLSFDIDWKAKKMAETMANAIG